jgi:hypothetical protein
MIENIELWHYNKAYYMRQIKSSKRNHKSFAGPNSANKGSSEKLGGEVN